ncbi:SPOR domain-containing protein [Marinobacter orientalis]|uniref:Sporulation protein n=1 Tax=Marinobacter orientalis TaxID=1928859 RepID=A0A7Y0RCI0_9GAMM|nr:SPOR domain-containing protein [Marinobacter orientalis]NMT63724.1 sporulation protein [Marinobacter orientalis]TGX49838.1 sporulation protein [Marinobacter orientalis]
MDGLKQRIIGALVLVSLAVIFVPMMFDEPHSERESTSIKIPEEPPFPEVEAPEPEVTSTPAYRLEESGNGESQPAVPEPSFEEPPQEVSGVEAPEPAPTAEAPEVSRQQASEPEPEEPASEESSAEFTRSLEGAWVVQLGSFGSSDNASALRDKVRDKGYNSHLQRVTRGDAELTRVFSGPFAEKAEAEKAKQVLDKTFGLNSLVTSGGK